MSGTPFCSFVTQAAHEMRLCNLLGRLDEACNTLEGLRTDLDDETASDLLFDIEAALTEAAELIAESLAKIREQGT